MSGEPQELEIVIAEDGEVRVEVIGAKGGQCLTITKALEDALGEVQERRMKSEFYDGGAGEVHVGGFQG